MATTPFRMSYPLQEVSSDCWVEVLAEHTRHPVTPLGKRMVYLVDGAPRCTRQIEDLHLRAQLLDGVLEALEFPRPVQDFTNGDPNGEQMLISHT